MTFGSLFSGIGGMDLGLERAGMVCKWQVEIDPFCQKVLAKHWPGVKRYGDIRTVTGLEHVDVIAGGFPCQDVSVAGKRCGITGPRSGLWAEYFRIICQTRPRFVLVENVSGLLMGGGIQRVLGDLASIRMDAEWNIISAAHLGAFHHRPRVFILAYANSNRRHSCLLLNRVLLKDEFRDDYKLHYSADGRVLRPVPKSRVFSVADGFSSGLDSLRGAGNAVCPPVAEWIGRRIMETA